MKKTLLAVVLATVAAAAVTPAHALSESYRNKLAREHKTQVEDAAPVNGGNATYVYADNVLEVQVDHNCRVKKANGFKPRVVKQVKKDMWEVTTGAGVVLSVLKLGDSQCDITWTQGSKSGILKVQ
ncbi:TPA: hypothetical protein JG832_002423 [Enterobacter hormaechei subsp. xiangfangensis]|nr:hypothetical protein [Enterobacter hormaechei subsp. xiangfangensis]HAV1890559.1 hypothetical protein [Enterobacter hormaechei subsp. xiangfangensis]